VLSSSPMQPKSQSQREGPYKLWEAAWACGEGVGGVWERRAVLSGFESLESWKNAVLTVTEVVERMSSRAIYRQHGESSDTRKNSLCGWPLSRRWPWLNRQIINCDRDLEALVDRSSECILVISSFRGCR
jgi:hypothetical protein